MAALLLALAIVVLFAVRATAAQGYGGAYLSTLPSGVNVWIDGTYVGKSPVLVDALSAGHHAVTLTKAGWLMQEADLDVNSGSTAMVSYRMRLDTKKASSLHAFGSVTLHGLAGDARIAIDGQAVRESGGSISLAAGTHVAVITTGARKVTRTFTIYADTTTEVVFADALSAPRAMGIVAPAEEFLPDDAYSVSGKKVMVRYGGHQAMGTLGEAAMRFDGTPVSYDAAPSRIKGKLYLPLALLTRLTASKAK